MKNFIQLSETQALLPQLNGGFRGKFCITCDTPSAQQYDFDTIANLIANNPLITRLKIEWVDYAKLPILQKLAFALTQAARSTPFNKLTIIISVFRPINHQHFSKITSTLFSISTHSLSLQIKLRKPSIQLPEFIESLAQPSPANPLRAFRISIEQSGIVTLKSISPLYNYLTQLLSAHGNSLTRFGLRMKVDSFEEEPNQKNNNNDNNTKQSLLNIMRQATNDDNKHITDIEIDISEVSNVKSLNSKSSTTRKFFLFAPTKQQAESQTITTITQEPEEKEKHVKQGKIESEKKSATTQLNLSDNEDSITYYPFLHWKSISRTARLGHIYSKDFKLYPSWKHLTLNIDTLILKSITINLLQFLQQSSDSVRSLSIKDTCYFDGFAQLNSEEHPFFVATNLIEFNVSQASLKEKESAALVQIITRHMKYLRFLSLSSIENCDTLPLLVKSLVNLERIKLVTNKNFKISTMLSLISELAPSAASSKSRRPILIQHQSRMKHLELDTSFEAFEAFQIATAMKHVTTLESVSLIFNRMIGGTSKDLEKIVHSLLKNRKLASIHIEFRSWFLLPAELILQHQNDLTFDPIFNCIRATEQKLPYLTQFTTNSPLSDPNNAIKRQRDAFALTNRIYCQILQRVAFESQILPSQFVNPALVFLDLFFD